jgi:hypothetical protein
MKRIKNEDDLRPEYNLKDLKIRNPGSKRKKMNSLRIHNFFLKNAI